jgi:hypothetical protein
VSPDSLVLRRLSYCGRRSARTSQCPEGHGGRSEESRSWLAVAILAFLALSAVALELYGALPYLPGLAAEFGASLAAFMLALRWEGYRAAETAVRAAREADELRRTEARKRLLALEAELKRNEVSIDELAEKLPDRPRGEVHEFLHPELLDGAWASSGERLGDLLADYDLVAHLATFYGRLEELRWRIRHRTQERDTYLDGMAKALAVEMQSEVDEARDRVSKEAKDPEVRRIGLVHVTAGTVTGRAIVTAGPVSG